jgi:hypothetical protein
MYWAVDDVPADNVLSLMKKMTKIKFPFLQAVGGTPTSSMG